MVFLGIQRRFILSGYTSQSELHGFGHNGGGHGIIIQYLRRLQHQSHLETSAYYWLPQFSVLSTLIESNLLPGCHLTADDVKTADHIYSHDLGSIKGKTIWLSLELVKIPSSNIPPDLMAKYRHVILAVDVMFVNKISLFIIMSCDIKFNTVEM